MVASGITMGWVFIGALTNRLTLAKRASVAQSGERSERTYSELLCVVLHDRKQNKG